MKWRLSELCQCHAESRQVRISCMGWDGMPLLHAWGCKLKPTTHTPSTRWILYTTQVIIHWHCCLWFLVTWQLVQALMTNKTKCECTIAKWEWTITEERKGKNICFLLLNLSLLYFYYLKIDRQIKTQSQVCSFNCDILP